jgi:hypothetical protein
MAKYIPDQPHLYQGKQVIIDSDRLVFNANTDSIFLYSEKAIGFSTNGSIHFDTSDRKDGDTANNFIVNAPNIYLGLEVSTSSGKTTLAEEPAVLGHELCKLLNDLFDTLIDLENTLTYEASWVAPLGATSVATNVTWLTDFKTSLKHYKKRLGKDFDADAENSESAVTKGSILSKKVKLV